MFAFFLEIPVRPLTDTLIDASGDEAKLPADRLDAPKIRDEATSAEYRTLPALGDRHPCSSCPAGPLPA